MRGVAMTGFAYRIIRHSLALGLFVTGVAEARADSLPLRPAATLRYTVDSGTGMSIDVSPDGRTIIFDMLGDLYALPISGGRAHRLTSGMAWDAFPRFSPDGKRIAFISDRSGLENLWVMDADGHNARIISHNRNVMDEDTPFTMRGPVWAPDGQEIAVRRKQLRNPYSRDELWLYNIASGEGQALTGRGRRVDEPAGPTGAAFTPDGKGLVLAMRDPWDPKSTNALWYVDRQSLKRTKLLDTSAVLSSPTLSRDGKTLGYFSAPLDKNGFGHTELHRCSLSVAQGGAATCTSDALVASDLGTQTSSPWWTWPQGAVFAPDQSSIIAIRYGKLMRFGFQGEQQPVPMLVKLAVEHAPLNRTQERLDDGPMPVRQIFGIQASSDGNLLVFGALDDIWTKRQGGPPKRLEGGPAFRFDPALSADGKWITYASWSDHDGGSIWKQAVAGGIPILLAKAATHLFVPIWSPAGDWIAFLEDPDRKTASLPTKQKLMMVSAKGGGEPVALAGDEALDLGQGAYVPAPQLSFSGDGRFIYLTEMNSPKRRSFTREDATHAYWRLVRIDTRGGKPDPIADFYGLNLKAVPSPDGHWLAIQHSFNLYLLPMPKPAGDGSPVRIEMTSSSPDPRLVPITKEGGTEPLWSADGATLSWSWMNQYFRDATADLIKGTPKSSRRWTIDLKAPRPIPPGDILLTGSRVITMAEAGLKQRKAKTGELVATTDPGLLPCGDILISGRRIKAVGSCGTVQTSTATPRLDMSGKTLMPGLIAMHEHRNFFHQPDEQPRELTLMLAHGITTARDPGQGYEALHTQELVDSGRMVGPRWFGTLIYMFGADFYPSGEEIGSEEDALHAVRKFKSAGSMLLKDYFKPHRIQRQWLSRAALDEGIRITSDQGFEWDRHATQVIDGYPGFEHALNTCDVGPDLIGLFGRLGITYDPQLRLDPSLADQATAWLAAHPRPWWQSGGKGEFNLSMKGSSSAACRATVARELLRNGANVVFGRDEGLNGLEQHQMLWGFAAGGMTNAEILRVATIDGARGLGMARDLGSLEPGKIADILVLDADPLESIFNTLAIRQVIKDGVIYDGDTMKVITHGVTH
jgi:Tol biopolymer transport system component